MGDDVRRSDLETMASQQELTLLEHPSSADRYQLVDGSGERLTHDVGLSLNEIEAWLTDEPDARRLFGRHASLDEIEAWLDGRTRRAAAVRSARVARNCNGFLRIEAIGHRDPARTHPSTRLCRTVARGCRLVDAKPGVWSRRRGTHRRWGDRRRAIRRASQDHGQGGPCAASRGPPERSRGLRDRAASDV